MMQQKRINALVSGRVQGVYYRASTQQQAQTLGLSGWVRNLDDGRVEFEAQGSESQLNVFLQWAEQGPPNARVASVSVTSIPIQSHQTSFDIRY